jgi:hypothetical protein
LRVSWLYQRAWGMSRKKPLKTIKYDTIDANEEQVRSKPRWTPLRAKIADYINH